MLLISIKLYFNITSMIKAIAVSDQEFCDRLYWLPSSGDKYIVVIACITASRSAGESLVLTLDYDIFHTFLTAIIFSVTQFFKLS